MFLNDNQYFYVYLYWGKCLLGHIRPPPCKSLHKNFFNFFFIFFYFRCILLQISHKKCFFISISILGRSGVKPSLRSIGLLVILQQRVLKMLLT